MPIYEYECDKCGHEFEREQRMSDAPVKTCPKCKARKVTKLISRSSFVLKGGGWYADGYGDPKKGDKKDADKDTQKDADKDTQKDEAGKDSKAASKSDSSGDSDSEKSGGDKKSGGSKKGKSKAKKSAA